MRLRGATVALACTLVVGLALGAAPAFASAPTITAFTPISGTPGTTVVLKGTNFTGATGVTFNGASATYTVNSAIQITTTVPVGASTGPISVTTASGIAVTSAYFTVDAPPPSITLSPPSGPPGSKVTVTGLNFGALEGVDVYLGSTDEVVVASSATGTFTATFKLLASVEPGTDWVTAVGRHSGLAAQASFTVATDWPQFRGTANHRGRNTTENTLGPSNVGGIDLDWSFTPGEPFTSSTAVVGGVVYVGCYDRKVYALDASTGAVDWSYTTGSTVESSPAVDGGVVYVGSDDDKVYALSAATGTVKWSYTTGAAVSSSPAVANGIVYVGSQDDKVYALNAATGALKWSYTTGGSVASSPAVANGTVYVGSADDKLYALNATSGALKWSHTAGAAVYSSPAVASGVVYVGSSDEKVYALNATSGALKWSYTTGNTITSSPAVANGIVYIGSTDSKVYALNATTGAFVWSFTTGSIVLGTSPAVANGVVYIGSDDGNVYGLNAANGVLDWSYSTGNNVESSPVVVNGVVYAGSDNLYAFDLAGGANALARPNPAKLRPNLHLTVKQGGAN